MINIIKISAASISALIFVSLLIAVNFYKKNISFDSLTNSVKILLVIVTLSYVAALLRKTSSFFFLLYLLCLSFILLHFQIDAYFILFPATVIAFMLLYSVIHVGNKEYLKNFSFIYGLVAFITNIPNLFTTINIKRYDYFCFILISIALIYIIYKNYSGIRALVINTLIKKNHNIVSETLEFSSLLLLLFLVSTVSFLWDDINGYIWVPLASIVKEKSLVGRDLPASLYFHSLHGLSFISLLISTIDSPDWRAATVVYKYWNLFCFYFTSILFYNEVKAYLTIKDHSKNIFLISFLTVPFVAFQIQSNHTDFIVYLLFSLLAKKIIEVKYNVFDIKFDKRDFLVYGLLINCSAKALILLIPLLFIIIVENYRQSFYHAGKMIVTCSLLIIPSTPVFFRNYIYTGNPVFPSQNKFWKSEYFDQSGIVAGKFMPDWPIDFSLYFNFISNTAKSIAPFYSPSSSLYGFSALFVFSYLFLNLVLVKNNNLIARREIYVPLYLSIFTFFTIAATVGSQHKYFWAAHLYISLSLFNILSIATESIKKHTQNLFLIYLWCIFIPLNLNSAYTHSPYFIQDSLIYGSDGKKWQSKIIFYEKVNELIGDDKRYVIMNYLQDKLFLKTKNVYEADWYDFPINYRYRNAAQKYKSDFNSDDLSTFFCNENIAYIISNQGGFADIEEYTKKLQILYEYDGHKILKLKCN